MARIAAAGNALRISDCWISENPKLGKYPKTSGNQAPQIKNSRNIMKNSLSRVKELMCGKSRGTYGKVSKSGWDCTCGACLLEAARCLSNPGQINQHWPSIPASLRHYFLKSVCLFGPESTAIQACARSCCPFRTVDVPEFARIWLNPKRGICQREDIPMIARGQIASEDAQARRANRVLFCDTDVLLKRAKM